MEKKELTKKFIAGMFFVVGVFLICLFVVVISKDKGFTKQKFSVTVLYRNVGGLIEGAPTRLLGVTVGTVENIDFLEKEISGRRVKVVLSIFSKYKRQLEECSDFAIKTEGVLGEKLIEIDGSNKTTKLDFSQPIIGRDPLDVQDIAEGFTRAAQAFAKTSEEMGKIDMLELSEVMIASSRALLVTAEGINNMMDELESIANKARRVLDRVEQKIIEGNLFKVF